LLSLRLSLSNELRLVTKKSERPHLGTGKKRRRRRKGREKRGKGRGRKKERERNGIAANLENVLAFDDSLLTLLNYFAISIPAEKKEKEKREEGRGENSGKRTVLKTSLQEEYLPFVVSNIRLLVVLP